MRTRELIDLLRRFDPESEVHLSVSLPGRVIQIHDDVWVADHGAGPQINATLDIRPFRVYVGCGLEQFIRKLPELAVELGEYESDEIAAKVRDFYIVHEKLNQPLNYPDFDYQDWLPPRTRSGDYNEHIARILRDKLLQE
jgi:hypothetical protein